MLIKRNRKIFKYVTSYFIMFAFIFIADSFAQNMKSKEDGLFENTLDSAIAALQEYSKVIDNGIEDLKQRIVESPDDAALYYNLGTFYLIKYRNNNSSDQNLKLLSDKNWEYAIFLDPEYGEKVENIRLIYSEDSKKQSISSLIKEIEAEKISRAQTGFGENLLEKQKNGKDIQKSDDAEGLQLKKDKEMRYRFYALQNKDDKEGINNLVGEITEIIKSNSNEINMVILLKDIYVSLEKTEAVIEICSQGLVSNPDSIDLLMGRGDAYLRMRQYDLASIDFRKVLKINSDYKWAQERLDMININKQKDEGIIKELIDDLEWQTQFNPKSE